MLSWVGCLSNSIHSFIHRYTDTFIDSVNILLSNIILSFGDTALNKSDKVSAFKMLPNQNMFTVKTICWRGVMMKGRAELLAGPSKESRQLKFKTPECGVSLVVKIHLSVQETRFDPWWEDPTCHGAAKPVCHRYWACVLESGSRNCWSPCSLVP